MKKPMKMLVIDTETCNTPRTNGGDLNLSNGLTYNIGAQVIDKNGHVYDSCSLVIDEVFFGMSDYMQSAYYADKIPQYIEGIEMGLYEVVDFFTAMDIVLAMYRRADCSAVIAHNARFDIAVLNSTLNTLAETEGLRFFPDDVEVWDSMLMAGSTICKQKTYFKWCVDNDALTKNGQVRKSAEVLYRYLTKTPDFEEEHTALSDVRIESYIVQRCFATHRPMKRVLYHKISS